MTMFEVTDASQVFQLTDAAATKVQTLLEAEATDDPLTLRVAVRPGGCSGYSYERFFDRDIAADDGKSEHDGVQVVIDPPSFSFVTSSCVTVLMTSGPVTNM